MSLFNFEKTKFEKLWLIKPKPFLDNRGAFFRVFCKDDFKTIGFEKDFVQFNHSINNKKGTLRGLHFQKAPFMETKLVRCIRGKILDVVVDIRKNSPTFLKYFSVELSKENMDMLLIPEGFAHGFQTLEDNTEILYHHTNFYNITYESGLLYNDKSLNIQWRLPVINLSERDKTYETITKDFQGLNIQ